MSTLCPLLNVKPTVASLPSTAGGRQSTNRASGAETSCHIPVTHKRPSKCTLHASPSINFHLLFSGPFLVPPLGRVNGLAGPVGRTRVEQKAEDGSLIDVGLGWGWGWCLVITGPCCCFSPLFIPAPHHILRSLISASLYPMSTVFLSAFTYSSSPPPSFLCVVERY